jgi:hypothetical protein
MWKPVAGIASQLNIKKEFHKHFLPKVELDGGSIDVLATTASAYLPTQHRGIDHFDMTITSDIGIFLAFQQNIYIAKCG